jgi:N6-adenosine-specific RNA methylase IME4
MTRYPLIFADPAWRFGDRLCMSKVRRGADANYATMTTAEIAALPVGLLAADDAVLVLWRPSALARDALTVMDAWGFRHTSEVVWVKQAAPPTTDEIAAIIAAGLARRKPLTAAQIARKVDQRIGRMHFGMGRLTRAAKEIAIVGVRGRPYKYLANHSTRDVFVSPPLRHSAKPECVQDAFERMFPAGPWLELNARRDRPGWVCVGNEAPSHFGRDMREVLAGMVAA